MQEPPEWQPPAEGHRELDRSGVDIPAPRGLLDRDRLDPDLVEPVCRTDILGDVP